MTKPVSFMGHGKIPGDVAEMLEQGKQAIDAVKLCSKQASASPAANLETALHDGYGAAVTGAGVITAGSGNIAVDQIHWARAGLSFDVYQSDKSTIRGSGVVGSVTSNGDGSGTIAAVSMTNAQGLTGTALSATIQPGDCIFVLGSLKPATGYRLESLGNACGSADLYNTTISNANWAGTDTNVGRELDALADVRELIDAIAFSGGMEPNVASTSRLVAQDIEEQQAALVRFAPGDKLDPVGKNRKSMAFCDVPFTIDDFCPSRSLFMWEKDAFGLGVNREFDFYGNNGKPLVSETSYDVKVKVLGLFQVLVKSRPSVGRLKNITIDRPAS